MLINQSSSLAYPHISTLRRPQLTPVERKSGEATGSKAIGRSHEATTSHVATYDSLKRALDTLFAALLLIAALLPMSFIAAAIKLTSPGPVIFKQRRLTKGGRVFTMYKFRSMRSNAEAGCGPVWASADDPRVTSLGRFLRRTRLDELPQLLNVLRGEMSLIGPRPERPEIAHELARQLPSFNRRLQVPAGITGLAQISHGYASSMSSYRRKLAWDILYINNRSLWLDLRIALRTIAVICSGAGAR